MDREEVYKILSDNNEKEKLIILSHLKDVFESYNKNIDNFSALVQILIDYSVTCTDSVIQSEILETIVAAETYQDVSQLDFDIIEVNLDKCSLDFLPRYIDILSYTYNPKYIQTILTYIEHKNSEVRESAENALLELGYKTN